MRESPADPNGLREVIGELKESLPTVQYPKVRVSLLGQIGVHLRSLGDLQEAEEKLLEALEIIKANELSLDWEVQQKIRLAHVLQWKRSFKESSELFEQVISTCRSHSRANSYLDFALQHSGKNLFDQQMYAEALVQFSEALELREKRKAPEDQIESTLLALKRTKELLSK